METKHGIVLLRPAYKEYHLELGEVSSYPPGYKENAGIFCHNNPWIIAAETVVGHGDRAFDLYSRIAPAYREEISDLHKMEPYVYSQMIAGKDAKNFGQAKNSWLTGTAAFELGVQFHGKPDVYTDYGNVNNLLDEVDPDDTFSKIMDKLTVYPVMKIRLCGRIF